MNNKDVLQYAKWKTEYIPMTVINPLCKHEMLICDQSYELIYY